MRYFILTALIIASSFCPRLQAAEKVPDPSVIDYFNELVFGNEFGKQNPNCKKWVSDIKIYTSGHCPDYLETELDSIIIEINQLITDIELIRVDDKNEANFQIFFGPAKKYIKIEPAAAPYVESNYGLFWIYWNNKNEIYKGSMYVDLERTKIIEAQKHLLREELTQSLGIMNDSNRYPKSVFFQDWTRTTEYLEIDRQVIKILYHPKIKPNMTRQQFNKIIMAKDFFE